LPLAKHLAWIWESWESASDRSNQQAIPLAFNMPSAALAHLAKQRHIDMDRAEHLWDKAKGIVSKEYGSREKVKGYWALVMGITKKMMGVHEGLTFKEYMLVESPHSGFWFRVFDKVKDDLDLSAGLEAAAKRLETAGKTFDAFDRIYKTRQHQALKDAIAFLKLEMVEA
jgi:hypothetical protein